MKAKMTCRLSPQATVRQRICLRSVEPSHAANSTAKIPSTPVNRSKQLLLTKKGIGDSRGQPANRKNTAVQFPGPYSLFPVSHYLISIAQIFLCHFAGEDAAHKRHGLGRSLRECNCLL